jgi:hypothetical protein
MSRLISCGQEISGHTEKELVRQNEKPSSRNTCTWTSQGHHWKLDIMLKAAKIILEPIRKTIYSRPALAAGAGLACHSFALLKDRPERSAAKRSRRTAKVGISSSLARFFGPSANPFDGVYPERSRMCSRLRLIQGKLSFTSEWQGMKVCSDRLLVFCNTPVSPKDSLRRSVRFRI